MRATAGQPTETGEELERVPVTGYSGYGKRLTVILDRPQKKRCSFLFLTKKFKDKPGEYEQIFWQTQQGLSEHKSKYKLAYNRSSWLTVFIDTAERYAWNFPAAKCVREKLPAGDYAVKDDHGIIALVERKTMVNLLHEFGNLRKFHQHLNELAACRNSALVIEAEYGDLLDKERIRPYTGAFAAKALAEVHSVHPGLAVIFAGNRKQAAIWTYYFFQSVLARGRDEKAGHSLVRESTARYGRANGAVLAQDEARRTVLNNMPEVFTTSQLARNLPRHSPVAVRRVLESMKNEGLLSCERQGRDLCWHRKISI
jgi:ERCC4-type nuclease